jgi:hypothetical protein
MRHGRGNAQRHGRGDAPCYYVMPFQGGNDAPKGRNMSAQGGALSVVSVLRREQP